MTVTYCEAILSANVRGYSHTFKFVLVIKMVEMYSYWYKDGVVPSDCYIRAIGFSIGTSFNNKPKLRVHIFLIF